MSCIGYSFLWFAFSDKYRPEAFCSKTFSLKCSVYHIFSSIPITIISTKSILTLKHSYKSYILNKYNHLMWIFHHTSNSHCWTATLNLLALLKKLQPTLTSSARALWATRNSLTSERLTVNLLNLLVVARPTRTNQESNCVEIKVNFNWTK